MDALGIFLKEARWTPFDCGKEIDNDWETLKELFVLVSVCTVDCRPRAIG